MFYLFSIILFAHTNEKGSRARIHKLLAFNSSADTHSHTHAIIAFSHSISLIRIQIFVSTLSLFSSLIFCVCMRTLYNTTGWFFLSLWFGAKVKYGKYLCTDDLFPNWIFQLRTHFWTVATGLYGDISVSLKVFPRALSLSLLLSLSQKYSFLLSNLVPKMQLMVTVVLFVALCSVCKLRFLCVHIFPFGWCGFLAWKVLLQNCFD